MAGQWVYRMKVLMQFQRVCLTEEYNSSRLPPNWRCGNKGAVHIALEGLTSRFQNVIGRIIGIVLLLRKVKTLRAM
jgi:hypothetical protein